MHYSLQRQLKKLAITSWETTTEESWQALLELISNSYTQSDRDRYTLERSLQISSDEMRDLYESLKKVTAIELSIERDKLNAIINSMGIGLMMISNDGKVTLLNNTALLLLGEQSEIFIGKRLFDILIPSRSASIRPPEGAFDM